MQKLKNLKPNVFKKIVLILWVNCFLFSFINIATGTSPPSLSNPYYEQTFCKGTNDIIFDWSYTSGSSYNEIWIDNNSGFGSPEVGFNNGQSSNWVHRGIVSLSEFLFSAYYQNKLPQNLYYWKARALDSSQDPITSFSSSGSFILLDKITPSITLSKSSMYVGDEIRVTCNVGLNGHGRQITFYYTNANLSEYVRKEADANGSAYINLTARDNWLSEISFQCSVEPCGKNFSSKETIPVYPKPEPDLIVQNQSVNNTGVNPGDNISASCKVVNQGDGSASSSRLEYYLSDNSSYQTYDTYLDYDYVKDLSSGLPSTESVTLSIPSNTGCGTKYIIFLCDADNDVSESNENNNSAYRTIFVKPSPPSLSSPSNNANISCGSDVYFSWNSAACANRYRINICKNSSMNSCISGSPFDVSSGRRYYTASSSKFTAGQTYYWQVAPIDSSESYGWGDYGPSTPRSFYIQPCPPPDSPSSVSISPSNWTNQSSFTISWNNPNHSSEITGGYYKVGGRPGSNYDGQFFSSNGYFVMNTSSNGASEVCLWLQDELGNIDYNNHQCVNFYSDSSRPEIELVKPLVSDSNIPVDTPISIEIRDTLSGINLESITLKVNNTVVSPEIIEASNLYVSFEFQNEYLFNFDADIPIEVEVFDQASNYRNQSFVIHTFSGNMDADNDGLTNSEEYEYHTDPFKRDTDNDLLPDYWEVHNGTDPLDDDNPNGTYGDIDDDGLTNIQEYYDGEFYSASAAQILTQIPDFIEGNSITLTVGGEGVVAYKYLIDSNKWSDEASVENSIVLSEMPEGSYELSIIGKDSDGYWQAVSQAKSYQIVWSAGRFPFERPSGIPDTGQIQCYDNEKEIPCPNPGEYFYGQDASYNINSQSFTKLDAQGNELPDSATEWTMVRDNITGLIWEVKTDDGSIHDKDNTYEWHDIETVFIKALNDQQFAGVSDWRMPTIKELDSIADYGKYNPAIDSRFFPSTICLDSYSYYWSSTSWAGNIPVYARVVNFLDGSDDVEDKDLSYYVRAVRGGQSTVFQELIDNGDSTVTDLDTGLMWQQATKSEMNWENAIQYCENLSLAGFSDWRLPSRRELRSIVNYNKYRPSIDTAFFPETMSNCYWSSTSSHYFTAVALGIHFSQGSDGANKDSSDYIYVRAVRGGQNRLLGHLFIGSPQQSSTWQPGNSMPIKWLTQNISGNVTISISREGGKADTFVSIANNTPNDGEFEWTVPNTPSVNCMLKVVPVNAPEKGTTQGLFTILPPQPSNLSFEQTELTLHHMVQTMYTVSDPDSKKLTIVAFSSDPMLVPDTSINLGNGSNNYPIDLTPGEPVSLSLTCYQADKNYGQAIITVEVYDENSLSTTQQITVSVAPFHSLTCENCEITQTMGMVSAGEHHYLALKHDRNVVAWGANEYGQLGTGDTKKRVTPALVQDLSNIISIQSGSSHNLALRSDGAVLAWGYNAYGQLGIGNTTNQSSPVRIEGLNNIVAIAAGNYHSLALKADGTVWAWGHCYYKNSSTKILPIQVEMFSKIVAIAAGGYHSFALTSDGTIWSWGRNYVGQVGNGTDTTQYTPVQITTISNIISISTSSNHSMALHKDGSLYAWGSNWYGKLGNGNTSHQYSPVKVLDISNAIDIECSEYQSFAQLMDGSFMIWGYRYKSFPQRIQNMNDIVDLSAYGFSSKIALTQEGKVKTWSNQLPVFKEVMSGSGNIIDISSDSEKTCVVLNDGLVRCWGDNIDGIGNLSSPTPLQITKLHDIIAFETNNTNEDISGINTALRNDGTVWNWGENWRGQLGNGTTENSAIPIQVQNLNNIVSVCSKAMHSLAIKEDGSVWGWGYNYNGQLGDGTNINRYTPFQALNIDNIVAVTNNYGGSIAIKNDGTVWAWGSNWDGILGDGTTIDRHEPVKLNSLSDVVAIRASEHFKLALKSDGTVWRWGSYDYKCLLPQQIPYLENIVEIDISRKSYIARTSNNDIWVWGDIWNHNTFEHYHYPILLKNIPGVSKIKAGYACFFFFLEDETVWMWGYEHDSIPSEVANIFSTIQIQKVADQTFTEDSTFTIPVSLEHPTDVPYTISVHTTNPFLLHEPTVIQKQDAFDLMFTTRNNQHGQTNIVCVAEDSNGFISSSDFLITIESSPDLPEITNTIPQQILVSQETPYTSPMFYISDPDTNPSNLSISISSSNQSLLSDDEITYNCTYDNCYLVIPPKTEDGSTDIEITLSDTSGLSSVTSFSFDITSTKYQMAYLMSDDVKQSTGKAFTLPVMYDVSDKNSTLPGLGIRIHYDSTILTYLEATNHAPGLIVSQEKAEEPTDSDDDPNTDRMIALAWADVSKNWPNKDLPYHLMNLAFQVKADVLSNNTPINLGFTSTASGYVGKSENSIIHIDTHLPAELTFEQTELTLNHMVQTVFTVSDSDSEELTLMAFSSDQMLIPDAFINLGNSSNIKHINISSGEPVSLSLTCYQADKNYGQAVITVEAYDESGLSASQQLSISVSPFHSLSCENCEISQTMGMVSAGGNHYLALKPDGKVVAWGKNYSGQLGIGETTERITPALVQGLSDIVSIQSGSSHSLALRSDGTVWSWGNNDDGQLGIGNTTDQNTPVRIEALDNIVAIAAGNDHSLALQADGTVWTWGSAYDYQTIYKQPVQVEIPSRTVAIAAGKYHSLALKSDGTIYSWGINWDGQLGNGNTTNQYNPVQVTTIDNIVAIAAGSDHSMALHKNGSLYAWGNNWEGQLGNGETSSHYSPVQVLDISNAIDIECSEYQSYAQLNDGSFMVWGWNYKPYPQLMPNMDKIVDFSAYGYSSKNVLTTEGDIKSWENQAPVFKEVMPDSQNIMDISSDYEKTCVVLNDGQVWCWGNHIDGIGDLSSPTPLQITELHNIKTIETNISCDDFAGINTALGSDGTVWNWGANWNGQLGNGTTESSAIPVQVHGLDNIVSVSAKPMHSLAISENGSVWAWGDNSGGQLGDGTTTSRNIPVRVLNIDNTVAVANNYGGSLALKKDGTVWAWGANWGGMLGDGTTVERHEPVKLTSLSDIVDVRFGDEYRLALKSDGTVWTWGRYIFDSLSPLRISSLENIVEIDILGSSCIARSSNNDIWVWGYIWNNEKFIYENHPIMIKNIPGVSKIKAGLYCFYIFMEDETVWIWGFENLNMLSVVFNVFSTIQIQNVSDQTFNEDSTFTIPVSVTNTTDLPYTISVHASNPFLLHEPEIIQNQDTFDLKFTTLNNQHGKTNIIFAVEDSNGNTSSTDFVITIEPVPDSPEIISLPTERITILQGSPYTSSVFYIRDPDTSPASLQVSVSSRNESLVSNEDISYQCTYDHCYLMIAPIHETGTAEIAITVSDSSGLSACTSIEIFFPIPNPPPVASDGAWRLDEDTNFFIPLNATDPEDETLTYTIVEYPSHGTIFLDNDIVEYIPCSDYYGMDRFSYKANDGTSDSNTARVILTISPIDDVPTAEDLIFESSENTSCQLSFPYTDVDGDVLTLTINVPPQNGNLSQDLIYTPDEWFWGTDSLEYSLSDENFTSLTATVSIVVNRAEEYTLSVTCPTGVGEIEINGSRILLPWQGSFTSSSNVTITAISSPQWVFSQWDHDQITSTDNPLLMTMDKGKTITAHFVPPTQVLTLLGYQSVTINGELYSLPLEKTFSQGVFLNLQAIPQNLFKGWRGDIQSDQNPIKIDIQTDMTIGVLFEDAYEWAFPIDIETVDLPETYTDRITIGVSILSETQPSQLEEEYGCSLTVFSPDWKKHTRFIQAYQSEKNLYQWTIGVNPHGNIGSPVEVRTSRLYWNPSQFSDTGTYRMYQKLDDTLELVISDMRTETSYEVSGKESVKEYIIRWSIPFIFHLTTQPGWNLISLPIKPLDSTASTVFPETLLYAFENGTYVRPEILEPGKGYWIKATTDGYDLTGELLGSFTTTLDTGWHLIGGLDQSVEESFDLDCFNVAFGYQDGSYVVVSEFLAGKGYWVKINKTCEMSR